MLCTLRGSSVQHMSAFVARVAMPLLVAFLNSKHHYWCADILPQQHPVLHTEHESPPVRLMIVWDSFAREPSEF